MLEQIDYSSLDETTKTSFRFDKKNNLTIQECRGLCAGDLVLHKKNLPYIIVGFALDEATRKTMVLYRNSIHCWSRDIEEFMDGRFKIVKED